MTIFALWLDDAAILLRWLHVVAAFVWVGSAFALARLDLGARPRGEGKKPETLLMHAGAAFRFLRTGEADAQERALHFKYEAYAAWASGFALLVLIYCGDARLYLIDPQLWNAPAWAAILVAILLLPLAWLAYDGLCRTTLQGDRLIVALYLFSAALGFGLTAFFAGRGAFLLLGATLATIMAANIAHGIAPAQKKRLAALRAGLPADEAATAQAAMRALHNQYLALPVVFFMLSAHAPLTFASPHNGFVAALILAAGFLLRRIFLQRARGAPTNWPLAGAAAAALLLAFWLSAPMKAPEEAAAASAGQAIALVLHPGIEAAQTIVETRCVACHSDRPQWPGLAHAAAGLDLSQPGALERHKAAVLRNAVYSRAMPPPGAAAALDEEERATLLRWAQDAR